MQGMVVEDLLVVITRALISLFFTLYIWGALGHVALVFLMSTHYDLQKRLENKKRKIKKNGANHQICPRGKNPMGKKFSISLLLLIMYKVGFVSCMHQNELDCTH